MGFPGAGKTTLARELLAHLSEQGLACGERDLIGRLGKSRAGHYARLASFTLRRGRYVPATFRLLAEVRPATTARIRFAAKLAVWPYRLSVARARGFETVVLDQGILQNAWCVLLKGSLPREDVLEEALSELLSGCGADFAFISLDLNPALATARGRARGPMDPPFDGNELETVRLMTEHREHLEQVVTAGVRAIGAPHLRLDASRPISENSRRLNAFVAAVLGSSVGGVGPVAPLTDLGIGAEGQALEVGQL